MSLCRGQKSHRRCLCLGLSIPTVCCVKVSCSVNPSLVISSGAKNSKMATHMIRRPQTVPDSPRLTWWSSASLYFSVTCHVFMFGLPTAPVRRCDPTRLLTTWTSLFHQTVAPRVSSTRCRTTSEDAGQQSTATETAPASMTTGDQQRAQAKDTFTGGGLRREVHLMPCLFLLLSLQSTGQRQTKSRQHNCDLHNKCAPPHQ